MANKLTPPPPTGTVLDRWLALLYQLLTASGQILWTQISKVGSNLTDIETRNHADLQNINTASYTHLTDTQAADLTDGGNTTLHDHDGKRPKTGISVDSVGAYTSTLAYNETTRTVTITPIGATFDVFVQGVKYSKTTQSLTHSATGVVHFFYFDDTGTFVISETPWDLILHAPVCFVFQDATNSRRIAFEERHQAGRDVYWHRNQHFAEGTKVITVPTMSGYTLATGTDAACTFSLSSGLIADEDIQVTTETLDDAVAYNIMERAGASGQWQLTRANTVPFKRSGTVLQYNLDTAGTWSLATISNSEFVNYYVFGFTALPVSSITPTPTATQQIVIFPGQEKYSTLALATAESLSDLDFGVFPFQEIVPLYKLTYKYSSAGGGAISLEAVTRVIGTAANITAAAATVHNGLSSIQGGTTGEYYHLTGAEYTGTGAGVVVRKTGGAIDPASVGATTPGSGAFTTLSASGSVTLGDDSTDTLNVGNGGIYKGADGRVGFGTATPTTKFELLESTNADLTSTINARGGNNRVAMLRFLTRNSGGNTQGGSIGHNGEMLGLRADTGAFGSPHLAIATSGDVGIGVTPTSRNNTRLQVVDGIGFPATQVASSDPNTLDDYEEGTFTPTIAGTTLAGTATYTAQAGRYTKIGRRVYFSVSLAWSGHTGTGNMRISGLPFSSDATANNISFLAVGANNLTYAGQITAYVTAGVTQVRIATFATGGALTELAIDAAASFYVSGHYEV